MTSRSAPCSPWATRDDLQYVGDCAFGIDGDTANVPDDTLLDAALEIASETLFRLSGANWTGPCTDVVRPVLSPQYGWLLVGGAWGPPVDIYASSLFADSAASPGGANMMDRWFPRGWSVERPLNEIRLVSPVVDVTTVKVDGAVMDSSRYAIVDRNLLVRTDGQQWPYLQDVRLPDTQQGTMSVTYRFGKLPPQGGVIACAMLACEIAREMMPDPEGTRLPRNVTSMSGEGLNLAVLSPAGEIEQGWTGIQAVDRWLAGVRSTRRRPVMTSADGWNRNRLRRQG